MKQRSVISFILLLFLAAPLPGEAQAPDSVAAKREGFFPRLGDTISAYVRTPLTPKPLGWKAIAIPTALITYGTISVATDWLDDINLEGRNLAGKNGENAKTKIDDYTQSIPAVAVIGLNLAGVRGKNNLIDAAMLYAMSQTISHLVTVPTKRITAHYRPDSSDLLSFPSGHTSNAFVSAELLRQEYMHVSPWIGAGGYVFALATGYLRIYNNKHWFSDVVAGAGVGIISTRLSYWVYPKLKNLVLGKKAPGGMTMLMPTYREGMYGLALVHRFR